SGRNQIFSENTAIFAGSNLTTIRSQHGLTRLEIWEVDGDFSAFRSGIQVEVLTLSKLLWLTVVRMRKQDWQNRDLFSEVAFNDAKNMDFAGCALSTHGFFRLLRDHKSRVCRNERGS